MSGTSIAVGGMSRPLLMAHQYVSELRILREGIIYRQDGPAQNAKNDLHTFFN
jgi:hypothetical protein